jgi:hypothetical protein
MDLLGRLVQLRQLDPMDLLILWDLMDLLILWDQMDQLRL